MSDARSLAAVTPDVIAAYHRLTADRARSRQAAAVDLPAPALADLRPGGSAAVAEPETVLEAGPDRIGSAGRQQGAKTAAQPDRLLMAAYAVAIGLIGWAAFCVGVEGVKRQHLLSAKVVLVTDH